MVLQRRVRAQPTSEARALGAGTDRWVRAGAVVFGAGLLAIIAAVVPLFFGEHDLPTALNLAAGVLPPAGLAIALWALVRQARFIRSERAAGQPSGRHEDR